MQKHLKSTLLSAACLASAFLVSCAGNMNSTALVPPYKAVSHHTGKPISVGVMGGSVKSDIAANISNEDFKQALETSLVRSDMFKSVGSGGYQLVASINSVEQPMFGISMRVKMKVSYELSRGSSMIWRKEIESSYTAKAGEALVGAVRLRKATEGVARENIAQLIESLDQKSL